MIHGRNLILALGGTPLAGAKSCSIDCGQSFIPVASPTSGRWKEYRPEMLEWKISSEGLLVDPALYNTLDQAWRNGTLLTIRFYDSTYGINKTGQAYIENMNYVAPVGSLAKYTVSLRGNGALTNYGGDTINPTVLVQVQGWYYDDTGQDSFDPIDEDGSMVRGLQFTLDSAATVRVIPGDVPVLFGTSSLIVAIQDKEYIQYGQEYDKVITETDEVQLAAGTYYICYNYEDSSYEDPVLINLAQ